MANHHHIRALVGFLEEGENYVLPKNFFSILCFGFLRNISYYFIISFLIPSASANIDASLDCNRYTAEESKALCKSYEKERRELLEEISELHQKLKNTKAI